MNTINKYTIEQRIEKANELKSIMQERFESSTVSWDNLLEEKADDKNVVRLRELERMLNNQLSGDISGTLGERNAQQALELCDNIIILKNIQLPSTTDETKSQQNDFIVISNSCIYLIEVKNISAPLAIITEQGQLVSVKNNKKHFKGNVALQSNRHKASVKKLLGGAGYKNVPVKSIILFSNNFCTVRNYFKDSNGELIIPSCYCNTVEQIINTKGNAFSDDDMKKIAELMRDASAKYPERKYALDVDENEFIDAVDKVIADNTPSLLGGAARLGVGMMYLIARRVLAEF